MNLHIYSTPDEVIGKMAEFMVSTLNDVIKKNGICHLVLTGGNSPKKLYELLASPLFRNGVSWGNVYFYFGDERYVPFSHKDNNGRMVKECFFDPLNISQDHIFYMDTTSPPDISAQNYDKAIRQNMGNKYPVFDLLLLGLGDNSHTASLFPGTDVLAEKIAGIRAVYLKDQDTYRITMTAPMINAAKSIAFLVFGETKADAVFQVLNGERNISLHPAQLISTGESTHWFLDKEAVTLLA